MNSEITSKKIRYLEAVVSVRVIVSVQVPVSGGVVDVTQVKVDGSLTVLGADGSHSGITFRQLLG